MRVEFGLQTSNEYFAQPITEFGAMRLGVEALLCRLELELGLPVETSRVVDRLLTYRQCIEDVGSKDCFYAASFKKDSLGVTRVLLDWRDRWYEGGWNGELNELEEHDVHQRLAQMLKVEKLALHRVPPSHGQRLQRISRELDKGLDTQIESLVLLDRLQYFSHCWRQVLKQIGYEESDNIDFKTHADFGTDLHKVQSHVCEILHPDYEPKRASIELSADDSILAVRSSSRDVTARVVAELLQRDEARGSSLVIAEDVGIVLDNAFERSGIPRCGFEYRSRFRAIDQVIRLALSLIWDPIRPTLLLQFLIHPVGPLDARIRRILSHAVSAEPGIGGPEWKRAVEGLQEKIRTDEEDERAANLEIRELDQKLRYWFHSKRFAPTDGAPINTIIERVTICGEWLRRRAHVNFVAQADASREVDTKVDRSSDPIRAMYEQAYAQFKLVFDSLVTLRVGGKHLVPKQELDRLLDEFLQPLPDPLAYPEALHVNGATHPGAVVEPFDNVLWWDMRSTSHREVAPWTVEERAVLVANGVFLESEVVRLRRHTELNLRPLMNCRKRFLMMSHPSSTEFVPHLLQTLTNSRFKGIPELSVEPSFGSESHEALQRLGVSVESQDARPLVEPRPYWYIPDPGISMRESESYSSLDTLFNTPHGYVIDYVAKLRRNLRGDMVDEQALRGSLAHLLLKQFFENGPDWKNATSQDLERFVKDRLPELIDTVGAFFYEPGRRSSQISLEHQISRALIRLARHLRSARVEITNISSELEIVQPYTYQGVVLKGVIDLLLETSKGELVIDVKWGGENYRASELQENRYLQLATYAYMRKKAMNLKHWPSYAFFIIETGQIIAPDASIFPNARVASPESKDAIKQLWEQVNSTYKWRRDQLESGNIEVNVEATVAQIDLRPDDVLEHIEPSRFESHGTLVGWRE